jgi:hypothetical protein
MLNVNAIGRRHLHKLQHLSQSNNPLFDSRTIPISNACTLNNVNNLKHL